MGVTGADDCALKKIEKTKTDRKERKREKETDSKLKAHILCIYICIHILFYAHRRNIAGIVYDND